MTTHELAKLLLEQPDLPVVVWDGLRWTTIENILPPFIVDHWDREGFLENKKAIVLEAY